MTRQLHYDVIVVGAGVAGSMIASELGKKGKRVLILNAGAALPASRRGYMENFFLACAKTPESPYPPLERSLDNPPVNPADPVLPGAEATPRPTLLGLDNWTNTSLGS
jgi:choline dehydrogenase-like flavoprotein